ncbi:hypothetical protein H2248_000356 [Termitomyces sp. 'cryptogamus']|nr:hypothetical protein H2248_000356 [Termitomyces sp. 'cryptogamus']
MYLSKWPVIIHSLISISISLAALVNVTVDATDGIPKTGEKITHSPPRQWNNITCDSCFDGTWHDSNDPDTTGVKIFPFFATIPFSGSAVYIYCTIANNQTFRSKHVDVTFFIDSQLAGNYSRELTKDGTFEYNVLVYANQILPQGNHNLTIQNGAPSQVLLDYIIYSYDDGLSRSDLAASTASTTPDRANSAGKIVGGVLGSIGGILLVLVAFLWHRQRTWKEPNDFSHPLTSTSTHTSISPVVRTRPWWRNPGGGSGSRFSFNPSLLVEPVIMNHRHANTRTFRRPPPVTIVHPIYPLPQRPDSTHPLQPNRVVTPTPSLDPRNELSHPLSIIEWQRRTQQEANDVPPRLDVSDVEMSSYYDFSSETPDLPLPQPPPRSAARRFTVVNN